jgi:hypothetical protein
MRTLLTILAMTGLFCSLSPAGAATVGACGPAHDPGLILKKVACPSSSIRVLIVGENHTDPGALQLKTHASTLSDKDLIFGFFEGRDLDHDQTFGLEDPLIYRFSAVYVARSVLTETRLLRKALPDSILDRVREDLANGARFINTPAEGVETLDQDGLLKLSIRLSEKMLATIAADPMYRFRISRTTAAGFSATVAAFCSPRR